MLARRVSGTLTGINATQGRPFRPIPHLSAALRRSWHFRIFPIGIFGGLFWRLGDVLQKGLVEFTCEYHTAPHPGRSSDDERCGLTDMGRLPACTHPVLDDLNFVGASRIDFGGFAERKWTSEADRAGGYSLAAVVGLL